MSILGSLFGKAPDVAGEIKKGATIIDVRTPGEFSGGHPKGAINIPLNHVEAKLAEIKKMKMPLILCCASGNRSGQATRFLQSNGIDCINGGAWTNVNSQL